MKGKGKNRKAKCPKCGEEGYERILSMPSGRYRVIRHIKECYLGRVEGGSG